MKPLHPLLSRAAACLLAALALGSCTGLAFGDAGGFGYSTGQPSTRYGYGPYDPYAPQAPAQVWPRPGGTYGYPPFGAAPHASQPWPFPSTRPFAPGPGGGVPWNRHFGVTQPEDDVKCDARRGKCYTWSSKRDRWREDYHETETYFGKKAARQVIDGRNERRR